jgi:hypothetical protein
MWMDDQNEGSTQLSKDDRVNVGTFMAELSKHVGQKAIITVVSKGHGPESWILKKDGGEWIFQSLEGHKGDLQSRLAFILADDEYMAVVLRSYTDKRDTMGFVIKELRGYRVWNRDGDIEYHQINAQELASAGKADVGMGKKLEPEPALIYCGPDGDRVADKTY